MNPTVILVTALAWLGSVGGAFLYGVGMGQDQEIASQAKQDQARQETRAIMVAAAASAISNIEVKHVTVNQRSATVMREVPAYRDCVHDQRVLDDINTARGYEPAGDRSLPAASAPR